MKTVHTSFHSSETTNGALNFDHEVLNASPQVDNAARPSSASLNFSVAKVIAIFLVAAGHWFVGTSLWILATFGLFVFAFSSAYFTSEIYGVHVERKRFWSRKFERLGIRYWAILTFLCALLAIEGKQIFHWHTLIHFIGLSGVLNWLEIPNHSALGAGLWFFTLLLIFYFAYPYIAKLCAMKLTASVVVIASTVAAVYLEAWVNVGHELWLTSVGFVWGTVCGLHKPKTGAYAPALAVGIFTATLLTLNYSFHDNRLNNLLIVVICISISLWLASVRLTWSTMATNIAALEPFLLEVFIIHTYFFIHPTGSSTIDFLASMVLTILTAILLSRIINNLKMCHL
jgi:hypothetical protein